MNNDGELLSAEAYYIEKTALYQLLLLNDSVRNSSGGMTDFFDALSGSSIDKFMQVEELLYEEDYTSATDILSTLEPEDLNTVELNYLNLYTLYAAYLEQGSLSAAEGTALYELATLCPGTEGACIYQAISLYNAVYNTVLYPNCDGEIGARKANFNLEESNLPAENTVWDVKLFPNPAQNQITLQSSEASENLELTIRDLSTRVIAKHHLKTNNFIAKLDLNLLNGVYLISIENSDHKKVTKKLLIAK